MRAVVVIPPEPIVTPADLAGDHAEGDASVAALIAAVTEEVDGPGGWLGRSLGPQTIELSLDCWYDGLRLPYGPVVEVEKIVYLDENHVEREVPDGAFWSSSGHVGGWDTPRLSSRPHPVKIIYRAGYDGNDLSDGGTGPVPERARQAIILAAQDLLVSSQIGAVRSETVEGIGSRTYLDADRAKAVVHKACDRLLSTLRVFYP